VGLVILLGWGLAAASEGRVATEADGTVRGELVVNVTVEEALALLQDPQAMHQLSGDGGALRVSPGPDCAGLEYQLGGVIPVHYKARGCKTAGGFRTEVIESRTFKSMVAEWRAQPTAEGTALVYTWKADLAIPVPAFVVRRSTEAAIQRLLDGLAARLKRG
jgi:hypothetical protein